jgi:hypothetical protein
VNNADCNGSIGRCVSPTITLTPSNTPTPSSTPTNTPTRTPTSTPTDTPDVPTSIDPYKCYRIKTSTGKPKPEKRVVRLIDALGNEFTMIGALPTDDVDATYPPTPIAEVVAPIAPAPPAPAKGYGSPVAAPIAASQTYPPAPRSAPPVFASPMPAAPQPPKLISQVGATPARDAGKPAIVPVRSSEADLRLVPSGDGFLLKEHWTNFGRSDANDIILLTPKASRYHGRFVVDGATCLIEDFGSGNGVRVNGERISEPRLLQHGDEIDIGEVLFVFRR